MPGVGEIGQDVHTAHVEREQRTNRAHAMRNAALEATPHK